MKILMILISGFILGAHAQGSVTIQSEVQQYLETFINQVSDELHVIIDASQARAGQFYDGLNSLKSKVDASLNSLGSQGKKAAKKINDEIDKLIKNMEKEFSDRTMRPKVKDSIGYIQSHYLDPIEKYIKSLKSAVDKNKKAMKCWDNNKNVLKAILDSAAAQTNTVIQPVVANLDSQVRAVAKKINDVVARIESEVKTKCGKSSTCVMQYFTTNQSTIVAEFKGYHDKAISDFKAAGRDVGAKLKTSLDATEKSFTDLKAKMADCVKTA